MLILRKYGRRDIAELVDYFNSMHVKEKRGELNDFVMRLEVLAEYLGLFILEKKMKISVDQISSVRSKRKNATRLTPLSVIKRWRGWRKTSECR